MVLSLCRRRFPVADSRFDKPRRPGYAAAMQWQKVTLAGVGLLGGSLGLALKRRRLAGTVHGYVRREASIGECLDCGVADAVTLDLAQAVTGADLIVLCTPLAQMRSLVERMLPALTPGAILTDVGSVKGPLVAELEPLCARRGLHFVGSHPMAGAEKMGVSAARADLFDGATCVTTPTPQSQPEAAAKVRELWRNVGGRTLELSPDLHDELVARCSHLPHVVAAHLVNLVLRPGLPKAQPKLCATGFRDTTRVASGSPEMWRDIAMANRQMIGQTLETLIADLQRFRGMLHEQEGAAIEQFFQQAKTRRDSWAAGDVSTSPE